MLCNYSMLVTSYKIGQVNFRLLITNGFYVKAENERFTAAGWRCLNCHLEDSVKTKKRAARAARLFFLIQPIKSLIPGVVAVISSTLYEAGCAKPLKKFLLKQSPSQCIITKKNRWSINVSKGRKTFRKKKKDPKVE